MTGQFHLRANENSLRSKVDVLDHGYVQLIDSMGTDETIIAAARMSTGKGFVSWEPYFRCELCGATAQIDFTCGNPHHKVTKYPRGDLGLLTTLYRDGHHTPFEMGELAIEIQAPIFVFREAMRHRVFSWNEFSC